jgi:transcription initiation factor TFIIIB Brf1 subunit/transcription initiation factor TFIIB
MSEIDYIPTLGAEEYVGRLSKQLGLCDLVRDTAIDLVSKNIGGSSPTIQACCAVVKATKKHGFKIKTYDIASTLDVTTTGIQLALKRET